MLRGYLDTIHKSFREMCRASLRDQFAIEIEFKVTAKGRTSDQTSETFGLRA